VWQGRQIALELEESQDIFYGLSMCVRQLTSCPSTELCRLWNPSRMDMMLFLAPSAAAMSGRGRACKIRTIFTIWCQTVRLLRVRIAFVFEILFVPRSLPSTTQAISQGSLLADCGEAEFSFPAGIPI